MQFLIPFEKCRGARRCLRRLSPAWHGCRLLPRPPLACSCPTAGDDVFVCDSGASVGGLTDALGNNTLSLPDGGTGTVSGNVVFGGGTDTIDMRSGTIAGSVDQAPAPISSPSAAAR